MDGVPVIVADSCGSRSSCFLNGCGDIILDQWKRPVFFLASVYALLCIVMFTVGVYFAFDELLRRYRKHRHDFIKHDWQKLSQKPRWFIDSTKHKEATSCDDGEDGALRR